MGCDIHFYVEKRVNGMWVSADTFKEEDDDGDIRYHQVDEFYGDRNYNLFAILADVRNGLGFAGVETGDGFKPISQPKGLPHDVSKEMKRQADSMRGDGHSHSWFTLRELLNYDWTQTSKLKGWVDLPTWADWSRWDRQHGRGPASYSGAVYGKTVMKLPTKEMDELAERYNQLWRDGNKEAADAFARSNNAYGFAEWEQPYYRCAGTFLDETIPRLLKLAGGVSGVDDVRIVFFFDN